MERTADRYEENKGNKNDIKTFSVPINFLEIKENIRISTNITSLRVRQKIINLALKFH